MATCNLGPAGERWKTAALEDKTVAGNLVSEHLRYNHLLPVAQAPPAQLKPKKLDKPKLELKDGQVEETVWEFFSHKWTVYKVQANVTERQKHILEACLSPEIQQQIFNRLGQDGWAALNEAQLLESVKEMFVRKKNRFVNRIRLAKINQGPDEPVQQYLARLKQGARICQFTLKCTAPNDACHHENNYADEMVLDQLVVGLYDSDIQGKVLASQEEDMTIDSVERLVKAEELSKVSQKESKQGEGTVAGMGGSAYKKKKKKSNDEADNKDGGKLCFNCGNPGHFYRNLKNDEKNRCPAHGKSCRKCGKANHLERVCKVKSEDQLDADDVADQEFMGVLFRMEGLISESMKIRRARDKVSKKHRQRSRRYNTAEARSSVQTSSYGHMLGQLSHEDKPVRKVMGHARYAKSKDEFIPTGIAKGELLDVEIVSDARNYFRLGGVGKIRPVNSVKTESVADTGAALVCAPTSEMGNYGVRKSDLIQSKVILFAADRRRLKIHGFIPVVIRTKRSDRTMAETRQLLYFVEGLTMTFMSREALESLGSISTHFPHPHVGNIDAMEVIKEEDSQMKCSSPDKISGPKADCGCPARVTAPDPPKLELQVEDYTVDQLKVILMNHYGASTFNTCKHQKLPKMHGAPLELHVDPKARPYAVHTPITVPAHWDVKVKADLDRDVDLGVIEPVPLNTPVRWCARMVVARKHNGDPRRTVDLQPLNNACLRQTHHTAPPFQQASTVPHNTVKTCLDAWNGYHSVDLRPEDRDYTTFITPYGRYRYIAAPQGWLFSGDAYTHRYDLITIGKVKDCKRDVDDTLMWDKNVASAFTHTAEYLSLVGRNGIILNPDKFVFAQDTVDWAGFRVGPTTVEPLPEHVESIRDYPIPMNVTDMRSFFALVEQVAPFYAVKPRLLPFRELLKKYSRFYWDDNLQKLFEEARLVIADAVIKGITRFKINRETVLMTDWSKTGVGFILTQKYCKCINITPTCCRGGWEVCMIGSRFNSRAEGFYSPVEGEAMAVTNGLMKTKYYTLGCERLTICVDHKPLLGVLNEAQLENIDNPRLRRLKEKTLGWRFRLIHIPGLKLGGTDAMSRMSPTADSNIVAALEALLVPEAFRGGDGLDPYLSTMGGGYDSFREDQDYFISLFEGIEEEGDCQDCQGKHLPCFEKCFFRQEFCSSTDGGQP